LAGGRSSRMGADKALIEVDGQTLVLRVAAEVAKVCGSVSIVGDPEKYKDSGIRIVPDSYPGMGPLAGIEAALGATTADANLIVACDMPLLRSEVFEELFSAGGDCAVPRYEGGKVEPLCAVYSRRCHTPIRQMLETGVRAVNEALRLLESGGFAIRYLQVPTADPFANLNTPEDLAGFRQEYRRG
jgi:molybdopterin-guanine dinucleotide biosynthesis protein A